MTGFWTRLIWRRILHFSHYDTKNPFSHFIFFLNLSSFLSFFVFAKPYFFLTYFSQVFFLSFVKFRSYFSFLFSSPCFCFSFIYSISHSLPSDLLELFCFFIRQKKNVFLKKHQTFIVDKTWSYWTGIIKSKMRDGFRSFSGRNINFLKSHSLP